MTGHLDRPYKEKYVLYNTTIENLIPTASFHAGISRRYNSNKPKIDN